MKKKKPHVCVPSCGCSGWINAPGRLVGGGEHVARVPYCVSNTMVHRQGQLLALYHALKQMVHCQDNPPTGIGERLQQSKVLGDARKAIAWAESGEMRPTQVWVVQHEYSGDQSVAEGVYPSEELATAARDAFIREAAAKGHAMYWHPDHPDDDDPDWDEDFTIDGPHTVAGA